MRRGGEKRPDRLVAREEGREPYADGPGPRTRRAGADAGRLLPTCAPARPTARRWSRGWRRCNAAPTPGTGRRWSRRRRRLAPARSRPLGGGRRRERRVHARGRAGHRGAALPRPHRSAAPGGARVLHDGGGGVPVRGAGVHRWVGGAPSSARRGCSASRRSRRSGGSSRGSSARTSRPCRPGRGSSAASVQRASCVGGWSRARPRPGTAAGRRSGVRARREDTLEPIGGTPPGKGGKRNCGASRVKTCWPAAPARGWCGEGEGASRRRARG